MPITFLKQLKQSDQKTITVMLILLVGLTVALLLFRQPWSFSGPRALDNLSQLSLEPQNGIASVGSPFDAQVFLFPQNNPVSGVDVVVSYDPVYLDAISVTPNPASPFLTFDSYINPNQNQVGFTALAYNGSQPTNPIAGNGAIQLATITFNPISPTSGTQTTPIAIQYQSNGTDDSNIAVIESGQVVDALESPAPLNLTISLQADLDSDNDTDFFDFDKFLNLFTYPSPIADFNQSGAVDILDFNRLVSGM